jgi:transcriptional regulator with XRE-family HTH domain
MKPSHNKRIADTLRRLRRYHDLPQKHLAAHLGISQAAYSKMERGCMRAEKHLPEIAKLYGLPLSELEEKSMREVMQGFPGQVPHS